MPCAHWGEVQINVHLSLHCILYTLPIPSKWPADKWRLYLMHEAMPFLLPHLCSTALCAEVGSCGKSICYMNTVDYSVLFQSSSQFITCKHLSHNIFWTSSDENKLEKQDLSINFFAMTWNLIQVNKKYWHHHSNFERWSLKKYPNQNPHVKIFNWIDEKRDATFVLNHYSHTQTVSINTVKFG